MKNKNLIKLSAIISGIVTAIIAIIMNFFLIPDIENDAGMRCFDMNFGYSYDDAVRFLTNISEHGKQIYLSIQLPLDFIYPVAYCVFFCTLFYLLCKKKTVLLYAPVILAVYDYIENICSVIMLNSNTPSHSLVSIATTATMAKTLIMYLCFLIILVLIIISIIKRKKASE